MNNIPWTKEEIAEVLSSDNISKTSIKLQRTRLAINVIRTSYKKWLENKDIGRKNLERLFEQVGKRDISDLSRHNYTIKSDKTKVYFGGRRETTLEEVEKVILGLQSGRTKEEIARGIDRTPKRVGTIYRFYKHWIKTGRSNISEGKLPSLFIEFNKKHNLPMPTLTPKPKEYAPEELPPVMSSSKRDPFTEIEILFDNFKEHLTTLVVEMAKDVSEGNLKNEYERGFKEGYEKANGENSQEKSSKSVSEILKNKFNLLRR